MFKAIELQSMVNVMFFGSLRSINRNNQHSYTCGLRLATNHVVYVKAVIRSGDCTFIHENGGETILIEALTNYRNINLTGFLEYGNIILSKLAQYYGIEFKSTPNGVNSLVLPFKE